MARKTMMTRDELVALFAAKATEPSPEADRMLARHLQCKASVQLTAAVREAIERYPGSELSLLPTPSTLLPPLM